MKNVKKLSSLLLILSMTLILFYGSQTIALPDEAAGVQVFEPYKFIAYGDTRNTPVGDNTGIEKTSAMIEDVMADHDIEFILHVGDIVDSGGSQDEYDSYWFPHMGTIVNQVPFYVAPGNHEYAALSGPDDLDLSVFRSNVVNLNNSPYSEQFFSFDQPNGDTHFIILNEVVYFETYVNTTVQADQMAWLEADLAATTASRIVVMGHYPLYGASIARIAERVTMRDAFLDLFIQYDVDFVIAGHDHQVVHQVRNETDHLITGAGTAAYTFPTPPGGLGNEWEDGDWALGGVYAISLVEVTSAGMDIDVILDNGTTVYEFFVDAPIPDVDAPVLTSPADLSFTVGDTGKELAWTVTDLNSGTYSISVDGVEDQIGTFDTGDTINYDVSSFAIGTYAVVLNATDSQGNSGTDSVQVVVTDVEVSTTTTTTEEEPTGAPGFEILFALTAALSVGIYKRKR
ncbi:MAG: metallophosphoesterase family protein [Candidatus Hodarchaeales archaeon]|jgi:predicted phosphodiesterase